MQRLAGKSAVITGGCSGIGLATVELFAAEGARVLVADIDAAAGEVLSARIGAVRFQPCDVTREADIAATMQAAADAFGAIDILFNNAGAAGAREPVAGLTAAGWDATMGLILRSAALGMRHVVPHMPPRGGAIVNVSSTAGLQAGAAPSAYAVAKAAILHLTRCAAAELAARDIRVNAICPGLIVTPIFTAGMGLDAATRERVDRAVRAFAPTAQPLRRAGAPIDVARACLFLASDEASFITGAHLTVDGGISVGPPEAWDPDANGLGAVLAGVIAGP